METNNSELNNNLLQVKKSKLISILSAIFLIGALFSIGITYYKYLITKNFSIESEDIIQEE